MNDLGPSGIPTRKRKDNNQVQKVQNSNQLPALIFTHQKGKQRKTKTIS